MGRGRAFRTKKQKAQDSLANIETGDWQSPRKNTPFYLCKECLVGRHSECVTPKYCPCVCNDKDFPLNIIRNK